MNRVLLGQLGSNGDCLYATILARQIKADDPGCHLTWAISRQCRHLLRNNPHVDEVWEWDVPDWAAQERAWTALEAAVLRRQQGARAFDRVCLSQIWPSNFRRYDGTVRPSVLRAHGGAVTVPIDSVIVLDDQDRERVDDFVRAHRLADYDHRILFECASKSGQSFVTPDFALDVARRVGERLPGSLFILSTHQRHDSDLANVVWADELGMRENVLLTHHCDLFVGCGSGLTVVATSEAAAALPNIQILGARTSVYASFHHDFLHYGKPAGRFIEMGDADAAAVAEAIIACRRDGLTAARAACHRPLAVSFDFYRELIDTWLLRRGQAADALESLSVTMDRYGPHPELIRFGRERVIPLLDEDPGWWDPRRRQGLEPVRDRVLATGP